MIFQKFLYLLSILGLCFLPACNPDTRAAIQDESNLSEQMISSPFPFDTDTATPFLPATITATQLFTATTVPTNTSVPTEKVVPSSTLEPTSTGLPEEQPDVPDEYFITDIFGHRQTYSISCEASAATDWANFFGVEAYESTIQFHMPLSDNPDFGFVGNVNDPWGQIPPYSYGVHAEPVAAALRELYDLPARAEKEFSLE